MTCARETVEAVLTETFNVLPQEMKPEAVLSSLDMDSLAVVELLFVLERELGVKIGEDEVTPRNTVRELVATVEAKLARRSAGPGR
ncbi:acyl carrier protein [Streptomyces sp. NPDC090442]|uniref:acyl carrier protein n=1 Tax=Streptomyces sp. NPDC090442 TaxID=3365962 RepID=UPI0037FF6A22